MDGNVKWLTVVHRKLGTDDESSTDEEVLDRVLMHYPEVGLGEKVRRYDDKLQRTLKIIVLIRAHYPLNYPVLPSLIDGPVENGGRYYCFRRTLFGPGT